MTSTRSLLLACAAGATILGLAEPAFADDILFTTGSGPDGARLAPGGLASGPTVVRGGITQVRTADGAILSFVGDARFHPDTDGIRIDEGRVTARAGANPLIVTSADGTRMTLSPGAVAGLSAAPQGAIEGRALAGTMSVAARGRTRSFSSGDSFAASNASGPSMRVTAGAQPVTARPLETAFASPAGMAQSIEGDEFPGIGRFANGSRADLLAQAIASADGAQGLDFAVSRATLDVNLAYLRAGGAPGSFSPAGAGAALEQYLSAARAGGSAAVPASLAQAYLGYFGAEGLAGLDAGQRSLIDAYQRVVSAAGTPAAFNDHTIATAYSAYVRAIADGTTSALSGATLAAYENYLRVLGGTQVLDAGQRAQIEAFQAVRAAGLSGASADLSNLLVSYLDHLARGGAATAFTGADGSALAAALAYLSVIGLPADFNAEPAARIAAFAEYIRAGGAIGSLPPTLNPNPNPSPNPNPDPQPEVPASTMATWIGGYGGDGYKIDVTLNQNGVPTAFGALKVGTARLLDSSRGAGWQVGRYGDGTMVQTYRGTETSTSYGPNDGLHFAFATSNVPLTLNTGSATYGIAGFTRPTYADASEVTAANLSGSLAVDFATLKAGIEAILTTSVAGTTQSYTMSSTGGIAAPSAGIYGSDVLATNIRVNVTSTDTARCATSCTGLFALAGSGANAEVVVGTYALSGAASILRGAAAFTQSTRSAPPPGAPSGTGLEYRGLGLGGNLIGFGAETVALGADGKLDLIDEWERGTATNNESGGLAGAIGWTRWAGGTIRTQNGRNTQDIAANNGRHLVWYRPLTNLPTSGSAGYSLIGGTAPTRAIANTAPGTLKSGALAVDFASMKVGIELAASVDGIDYTLGSRGGVAAPSAALGSNGRFGLNSLGIGEQIVMTGGGCTGPNCYGSIEGSLAGDGASHAAITYNFSTGTSGPQVQGVAAFGRD